MVNRAPTSSLRTMVLWQLAAAIFLLGLLSSVTQAGGLFVGFEESEGFPAVGTSFEGLTTHSGSITWSSVNVTSLVTDSGPGDAFGFANDPGPLGGSQTAFAISDVTGKAMIVMDLDNSANLALSSVNYAYANQATSLSDRIGFDKFAHPRFQIDYYNTNDEFIGTNAFGYGPDPRRDPDNLLRLGWGTGVADFNPVFQEIMPTPPFQDVALGKVVFKSFHDIQNNGDLIPRGRDFPNGPKPDNAFHLEDITLSEATTTFSQKFPADRYRVSFETSDGFFDADGKTFTENSGFMPVTTIPEGFSTVPGIDSITGADADGGNGYDNFQVDHGPAFLCAGRECQASTTGFELPTSEPDPIHGEQIIIVNSSGISPKTSVGNLQLDFDLDNDAQLAPDSFWFGYRGNGYPRVLVEYFGLDEVSLGTETWLGPIDGGIGLGLDEETNPDFDKLVIGQGSENALPNVAGVPLSRMIITADSTTNTVGHHASFELDNMLFVCTTGVCPEPFAGMPCDFDTCGS